MFLFLEWFRILFYLGLNSKSMIQETKGNLLKAKTEALVNAVNCVGVMGKGIALQFRREFCGNA
jgi:O-acetyl-ADP-ribose deacetylase (regulator of RNase III)